MIIVEQAPNLIWRAGTDKLCNYFNSRWLEFTGRTMDQERGNGWAEGVHPEDFDRCLDIFVSHFDRREVFEMRYRIRRYDGAWRWILDRGVPYYEETGEFAGYIGSCLDINEQVEAELALEEARKREVERLHALLPVCSWCRRIRTDEGYWQELGEYLSSQQLGQVTHGVCQVCARSIEDEVSLEAAQSAP
jgi:PAS domain S-box-containing protein